MKEKALTGASFAVGNVLATFPAVGSRHKALSRDDPEVELNTTSTVTSALSEPCGLKQVTWETTLYQPVFRKLVNESARIFISLQKTATSEENERNIDFIFKYISNTTSPLLYAFQNLEKNLLIFQAFLLPNL